MGLLSPSAPRGRNRGWMVDYATKALFGADRGGAADRAAAAGLSAGCQYRSRDGILPHGTPFQLRVWQALCGIPYGETISYKQLAERVGSPRGYRAVGLANNRNPISIFIPCHRVIGSDGGLVGYGGGLDIKKRLLALEAQHGKGRNPS